MMVANIKTLKVSQLLKYLIITHIRPNGQNGLHFFTSHLTQSQILKYSLRRERDSNPRYP